MQSRRSNVIALIAIALAALSVNALRRPLSERFLAGVRNALDDRARRGLVARAGAPEIPAVPELSPR